MAMNVGKPEGDSEVMVDINTTPLIDVMLVLLIMLIITIPIQTHAVKLDMPKGAPPPQTVLPEVVNLAIDFDGTMTWNGNAIADRATLENYLKDTAAKDPQPEIHIEPNPIAKYSYVAEALSEAQRLGVIKIGVIGSASQ